MSGESTLFMQITLYVHILAGGLGLISGAVALFAIKGAKLHRKSGIIFVYTMLVMSAVGAALAAVPHQGLRGDIFEPQRVSVIAGALAFYLVITAFLTVQKSSFQGSLWVDASAMLVALTIGIFSFMLGFEGLDNNGKLDGQPAAPILIFGVVALVAAFGDMRMMARGIEGTRRIARHLWRMCFALFIASGSFFLGQADKIPEPLRIIPILIALALAPLLLLLYWLWRVRNRRSQLSTVNEKQ